MGKFRKNLHNYCVEFINARRNQSESLVSRCIITLLKWRNLFETQEDANITS